MVGHQGTTKRDTNKLNGTMRKVLDVGQINQLGGQVQISLEQGIMRTYDWFFS